MMSILGCSAEELGNVLRALGFWADRRQLPAEPPAAAAVAAVADAATVAEDAAPAAPETAVPADAPTLEAAATEAIDTPAEPVAAAAIEPAESAPATEATQARSRRQRKPNRPRTLRRPRKPSLKWEEIWRPRRRGRVVETAHAREAPGRATRRGGCQAEASATAAGLPGSPGGGPKPAPTGDKRRTERTDRREPRRDGGKPSKPRREERPRVALQASPPGRKGSFDPDSPFAALSALKASLDKRTQE